MGKGATGLTLLVFYYIHNIHTILCLSPTFSRRFSAAGSGQLIVHFVLVVEKNPHNLRCSDGMLSHLLVS